MEIGHLGVQGIAGNLGVMPVDGEGDGRVAQHAEVEGVVGVLPDVLAADDDVLAEGLLQAGVELVAEAGVEAFRKRPDVQMSSGASTAFEQPCWRAPGFR